MSGAHRNAMSASEAIISDRERVGANDVPVRAYPRGALACASDRARIETQRLNVMFQELTVFPPCYFHRALG
jgi:hypothetical protein